MPAAPVALYILTPKGQHTCAGAYLPVHGEFANGQPVWKQAGGSYWLYSGTNGMWIVGASDAKEKGFACSKGLLFNKVLHGDLVPDKVGGVWHRLDGETFVEDSAIKVSCSAERERPASLHVISPGGQQRCAGEYVLQSSGEMANGQPVWKQKAGRCWLFSGNNGMWIVGGNDAKEKEFKCSRGVIYSKQPHGGRMPDKVGSVWLRLSGEKFQEDSAITVIVKPSPLYLLSPNGQQRCAGEYVPVADKLANGQPLWEHIGGKCWLYSGSNGMWIIGGSDAKEKDFRCTRGVIYCKTVHNGVAPDKMVGIWLRLEGDSFREDAAISVSPQPATLYVVSPHGQQRLAGEYVLRGAEVINGQPVWRQKRGSHWLHSDRSGAWNIGSGDLKDGRSRSSSGLIACQRPHKGMMPDKIGGVWQWFDGEAYREDKDIAIITVVNKPAKLHVASPGGQQRCAGEYVLAAGQMANGQPLWKQMGGKYWLYSGTNGMWIIGSSGAKDKNFECSRGVIYSNTPHGGLMPDRVEGSWLRLDGEAFKEDANITVGTKTVLLENSAVPAVPAVPAAQAVQAAA